MTRSVFPVAGPAIVQPAERVIDQDRDFSSYDITYEEEAMIEPDPLSCAPYEPPPWAFNHRPASQRIIVASEAEADRLVADGRQRHRRVVQMQPKIEVVTAAEPEGDE